MKKSGKKLLGIMLAAAVAITAVFPMQGMAAEGKDSEHGYQEEKITAGETSPEEPEESQGMPGEGTAQKPGEDKEISGESTAQEPKEGQEISGEGTAQETEEGREMPGEGTAQEPGESQKISGEGTAQEPGEGQEISGVGTDQEQKEGQEEQETQEEGINAEGTVPVVEENEASEGKEQDLEKSEVPEEPEASDWGQQKTFMNPQSGGEENTMPLEGAYDINQPVIESFEFAENGKTVTKDEELHFSISVYDADSDVSSISVELSGSYWYDNVLEFHKSQGNRYTAVLPCSSIYAGSYYIQSIRVEDEKSNYVDGKVLDENGSYLYGFILEDSVETHSITISDLQITKNSAEGAETLRAGDKVTYSANVQCENEDIAWVHLYVKTGQGQYDGLESFGGDYHSDTKSLTGTFTVGDKTYPAVWGLNRIQVATAAGRTYDFYPDKIEPEKDFTFTVDQEYDNDKPVIKSVTIDKNGQEVHSGETIGVRVDVEEDHPSTFGRAGFYMKDLRVTETVSLRYDADSKAYLGTIQITDSTYPGQWELSSLNISDTYNNTAYLSDYTENGEEISLPYYSVPEDDYDRTKPTIKEIRIENGELAKAGEWVKIIVEVDEKNPYFRAEARVVTQDWPNQNYQNFYLYYKTDLKAYVGEIEITETTEPCKWELTYLEIRDNNGNRTDLSEYEEEGSWYYTVDPDGYDVESPVIEEITIDKKGEWLKAGDTVTIKVKVDEKNPSYYGYAYFYPQVTNVSAYVRLALPYNPDTREYAGTIQITEDTYPCEWMLTELEITDQAGRRAYLSEYKPDWQETCPWYYRVKSGNTYREDVKDVTFHFYGYAKQEDGSYQPDSLISSQTVENVGRRVTLKELGIFPQPIEGAAAVWKYNWTEREVDEDTELLFLGTEDISCSLFASYDKGCANVTLTYMSENSGEKTVILPIFLDREATYQDVLDALELPEDGKADDFTRFKLGYSNDYHNETTQVGDFAVISVEAQYKNCQVAWNTRYLDKDGKEISKVITKSYLEGTKVSDALAELAEPNENGGMEFERWILPDAAEHETLSQPMASLDVVAAYSGKTTVDTSYTYRGEDGIITCGNKLMVMDGEGLSDAAIQGEATGAFKEVSHFKGLMLYEWTGTMDVNQEKYKKVQFQAQYYNCVAVLKYPDETCEYVVVDKNAEFTLPTENENYEDILWEGYEKGQTVVITEDKEFLAGDAKRKDGAKEEPEGTKLSQEEIARIKEELAKAEDGAVIEIDMKKATVVPKEVLEEIKDRQVNIVLDMGAYSWFISGVDVAAAELKDIDLEVAIGTDTVPSSLVEAIAEGKPATQISLTHNGEFGFRADLTLNLGSENSGNTANLYYYDSSGKLVFRNAGQIGADGTTSLSFSHASDYVVVIDKAAAPDTDPKEDKTESQETNGNKETGNQESSGKENIGNPEDAKEKAPKRQDDNGIEELEQKNDNGKEELERQDGRQEEEDTKEDALNSNKKNETANVKRNPSHTTADSGKTELPGADSSQRKSPKTGE